MTRALLLLACALVCFRPPDAIAQDLATLSRGVVKVIPKSGSQARIAGTGFIVRSEANALYIVTASHVVEGADDIGVEFFGTRLLYPARILGMEGGDPQGLAALIVEGEVPLDIIVLPMNQERPVRPGDPATMIGFPRNASAPWAVTKGGVVGRRGKAIVFSGAVDEGNSGGPLISDEHVVGVITQSQGQYAYASPSLVARYTLESWGVRFGVHLRSRPAALHPAEISRMLRDKGFNFNYPAQTRWAATRRRQQEPWRPDIGSALGQFRHDYEPRAVGGGRVVIDHATGLMWQRSPLKGLLIGLDDYRGPGTLQLRQHDVAELRKHIDVLNYQRYASFADWRLPTIEELASLLEPRGENNGSFIDPVFDVGERRCCITADKLYTWDDVDTRAEWVALDVAIDFRVGGLFSWEQNGATMHACGVRTMKADELSPRTSAGTK
jgi:hypothetical protein